MRLATELDQAKWNSFVFSSPAGSFLQSWEWGQVQKLLGQPLWRLILEDSDAWQAAALVIRRELPLGRCWLYVPHGPVFASGSWQSSRAGKPHIWQLLTDKLTELGKQEKALFIRIDPPHPLSLADTDRLVGALKEQGWRKSEREVQPQHTLLFDLAPSEEELLNRMHPKTRYNIRLAQRKGVAVRFSAVLESIDVFLELSRQVSQRADFHFHPDNYYRALLSVLAGSGMLEVAIAEYNGRPLAAHIMVYAGDTATYTHGASATAHRGMMGPTLLYWETIRRAKERGMRVYDFFGVAPPSAKSAEGKAAHPWAGITRIKEGFGGRHVSYIGAWDFVLDESFYTLVNTIRRIKQLWQ